MANTKYYSLNKILTTDAIYFVIFGERSNGKTYAVDYYALERYLKTGEQYAYIRRYDEDIKQSKGRDKFKGLICNGKNENVVDKLSKGKYNFIDYYAGAWYLAKYENGERVLQDVNPFAYAFALTSEEHYKSLSYPNITTICLDEFITRKYYLIDEFITFQNILSTIIRLRDNVKIFMLANTINMFGCPYFKEMGLNNVSKMEKGKIDVYNYGDTGLRVAVEFSDFETKDKKSNKYFAFDNPKLKMITSGAWEIAIYPHLPTKYKPENILYTYFVVYEDNILQCEIIHANNLLFTFIHRKTTPIKDDSKIVFQTGFDARPNYRRKINKPTDEITKRIADFYVNDKIFYQDNETGEIMRNYLIWCKQY